MRRGQHQPRPDQRAGAAGAELRLHPPERAPGRLAAVDRPARILAAEARQHRGRHAAAPPPAPAAAAAGRRRAASGGAARGRRRPITCSITCASPARSKRSVSGTSPPWRSAAVRPISITCSPPGRRVTVSPGGSAMPSTGRIRITSPSRIWVCSSTVRAAGELAESSRSGSAPALRMVRKPAPVPLAPAARDQGWVTEMSPTSASCAAGRRRGRSGQQPEQGAAVRVGHGHVLSGRPGARARSPGVREAGPRCGRQGA